MISQLFAAAVKRIRRATHILQERKATQVVLALCCFVAPILVLPLAVRESGTDLWVRAGLPTTGIKRLLIPTGATTLQYALTTNRGIYRSTDNGITWLNANSGLPFSTWGRILVQALAVSEANPLVAYAGIGIENREGVLGTGLYLTDDGGATWLAVGKEMAGKEVQAIATMPGDETYAGSVICVATGREIYRSMDGGKSWDRLDWRGVDTRILTLAIGPGEPDVIYVGTQRGGLYVTRNGGATWASMDQELHGLDVFDVVIAATDPRLIYLATSEGVYKSVDAGYTWTRLNGAIQGRRVNTVVVHPQNMEIVYAGLQHGAAYRSTDGGAHWTPLKRGLGDVTVFSLALDPRNPAILCAGTTDGIWRYVSELPMSPSATRPVLVASPTLASPPTDAVSPAYSITKSPTSPVTLTMTATPSATQTPSPTVTCTPSPTATHTRRPAPTKTPTQTSTATATAAPPVPPPAPTRTPLLR